MNCKGVLASGVLCLLPCLISAQTASDCDFDGDGEVGFGDFVAFAGAYHTSQSKYDLDSNGRVGFGDFVLFVRFYGEEVLSTTPNLKPYALPGWAYPIVASSDSGTTTLSQLVADQPTYFDIAGLLTLAPTGLDFP